MKTSTTLSLSLSGLVPRTPFILYEFTGSLGYEQSISSEARGAAHLGTRHSGHWVLQIRAGEMCESSQGSRKDLKVGTPVEEICLLSRPSGRNPQCRVWNLSAAAVECLIDASSES